MVKNCWVVVGSVPKERLAAGPGLTVTVGCAEMFVRVPPEPCLVLVVKVAVPAAVGAVTPLPPTPYWRTYLAPLEQVILTVMVQGPVPVIPATEAAEQFGDPAAMLTYPAPVGEVACGSVQPAGTTTVVCEPALNGFPVGVVNVNERALLALPAVTEVGATVIVPSPSTAAVALKVAVSDEPAPEAVILIEPVDEGHGLVVPPQFVVLNEPDCPLQPAKAEPAAGEAVMRYPSAPSTLKVPVPVQTALVPLSEQAPVNVPATVPVPVTRANVTVPDPVPALV